QRVLVPGSAKRLCVSGDVQLLAPEPSRPILRIRAGTAAHAVLEAPQQFVRELHEARIVAEERRLADIEAADDLRRARHADLLSEELPHHAAGELHGDLAVALSRTEEDGVRAGREAFLDVGDPVVVQLDV